MLANKEGRFKATILDHGVNETGEKKLATFICGYRLCYELIDGEWQTLDTSNGAMEITGYHYLEKKDGSVNESTIGQLKAAFGWDGRDPMWLQDNAHADSIVQLTLAFEEYEDKRKLRVKWVDAEDATGTGISRADDNTRRSISNRLGSKLRALAGSPVSTPKPSAARPPKPPTSKPSTKPAQGGMTMEKAWEAFAKEAGPHFDNDHAAVEKEWLRVLARIFPEVKDFDTLSPQQWAQVADDAPQMILPV